MNIKKDILWRVYLLYVMICLFALTVMIYIFKIQHVEGDEWRSLADSLSTSYQTIEAARGNIYAADGSLLATSLPIYEIRMDLKTEGLTDKIFDNNIDSLSLLLAEEFQDKTPIQYKKTLINARKQGKRYFLIKRKVTYEQMKAMSEWPIFRRGRFKGGFLVLEKTKRQKPFKLLAQRTIGYSLEGVATVGLEGAYDEVLAGISGKRLMQKVSGGVWVPINDENEIEPRNGMDVITTIDVNMQDVAEEALMRALQKHDAKYGTAVLMEVATGEIKAIANLTKDEEGDYWEKYNYAIGESTEPGSTFKLASAIALLEDKYIDLGDSIDTEEGKKKYFDRIMKDSEGGNGKVSFQEAFEISSNVVISKLIYNHYDEQPQRFIDYLRHFKLDKKIGLQIKGEGEPHIKNPKDDDWYGTTLPWMSIGYEVSLTPLQMLTFYNGIANKGRMIKPVLVKEVQETGKIVQQMSTEVIVDKLCSEETLAKVRLMLEGVVERGTARNLRTSHYKIAGKTGTSQILSADRRYQKEYKASFAGYFPADNPKYSCIVVINSPSKGVYYGGYVAGPVFREIADKVYANSIKIHPEVDPELEDQAEAIPYAKYGNRDDLQLVLNQLGISSQLKVKDENQQWVRTNRKDNMIELRDREQTNGLMPNVVGMSLRDAIYLLENAGVKVKSSGYGVVRKQSLSPGVKVIKGSTISLELS